MKNIKAKNSCLSGIIIFFAGVVIMFYWLFQARFYEDKLLVANILAVGFPIVLVNLGMACWTIGKVESLLKKD